MSLKLSRSTAWTALVLALCVAGQAAADDRDFLRERRARPNILLVLDSSGSMVGSPELHPFGTLGTRAPFAMVPGAGDDPYSRLGIAKTVLGQFLGSTEANFALAWYAQALPDGGQGVPTKHWVYEAVGQDHFRLVEPRYAYRIGFNERYPGAVGPEPLLINPADLLKDALIGYTPWFDPTTTSTPDRFGPIRAWDVDYTMPFDRMPIYFGTCFQDPKDGSTLCSDAYDPRFVFPFYTLGERDVGGSLIPETWAYDFERCDPIDDYWDSDDDDIPDDPGACRSRWLEPLPGPGSGRTRQHMRRVKLEMPEFVGLEPNHPRGVTAAGALIGNDEVLDSGIEDYDGDPDTPNLDLDGDADLDWLLYVDPVEQQRSRECGDLLPTPTPTNTPTPTHTFTPTHTPTHTPTETPAPSSTPTPTSTPLPSSTPTTGFTPLPTSTPKPTNTNVPSPTPITLTPTPSISPTPSDTPEPTATYFFD